MCAEGGRFIWSQGWRSWCVILLEMWLNILKELGTICLDVIAVVLSIFGIIFVNRKRAAVGRREMQLVLCTYLLLSVCDIVTTGRVIPSYYSDTDYDYGLSETSLRVLLGFASVQLGFTVAFFWMLLLFSIVGFQLIDDGTPVSLSLILSSAVVLFTATLYISIDTGFVLSEYFENDRLSNRSLGLYILYLGLPLLCVVGYAISQGILIMKVLGERKFLCKCDHFLWI